MKTYHFRRKERYKMKLVFSIFVILLLSLSSCSLNDSTNEISPSEQLIKNNIDQNISSSSENNNYVGRTEGSGYALLENLQQTGNTISVPSEYRAQAEQQGTVVSLEYESKDYPRDSSSIEKNAYVYLPYGYEEDTETRYDILYLMHGMGGSEGEYFTGGNGRIKNMLDQMIERGDVSPMIVVSPTFYTENSPRDFSGSAGELREFHHDFSNNLMPAVEQQFRTYAESTSEKDLMASRDHRAFGGFSLGSVTTWMEFCYDYDYIRYFLPMSGSCWYYGGYGDYYPEETSDFFEELIEENNLNDRGYFIYATTGTNDIVRDQVEIQMEEMLRRDNVFTPDRVLYYQKDGGRHDFEAVEEYIYNALPLFFLN